jgi:hypothetical protein
MKSGIPSFPYFNGGTQLNSMRKGDVGNFHLLVA